MLSERVTTLHDAFASVNASFVETVERCPEDAWANVCAQEGWSVAAVAHHIAHGHARGAEWIAIMTAGQSVRLTEDELNIQNAEDARTFAACTKADVLALNERTAQTLVSVLCALSAEDLDRQAAFGPAGRAIFPVERIAGAISRHCAEHLASIQAVVTARRER